MEYIEKYYQLKIYESDENLIYSFIEQSLDKSIIFFCDNHNYKLKIKNVNPDGNVHIKNGIFLQKFIMDYLL